MYTPSTWCLTWLHNDARMVSVSPWVKLLTLAFIAKCYKQNILYSIYVINKRQLHIMSVTSYQNFQPSYISKQRGYSLRMLCSDRENYAMIGKESRNTNFDMVSFKYFMASSLFFFAATKACLCFRSLSLMFARFSLWCKNLTMLAMQEIIVSEINQAVNYIWDICISTEVRQLWSPIKYIS